MDNALFRKNVLKVAGDGKQFKSGLKLVSTKTPRAQTLSAVIALASSVGAFAGAMAPYLSGASGLTEQIKNGSFGLFAMADMHLTVLAKQVKAKVPGAGRVAGLKNMTRTEGILLLNQKAAELLAKASRLLYPVMDDLTKEKKVFGKKEDGAIDFDNVVEVQNIPYQSINKEKSLELAKVFDEELRQDVTEFADLFARVCYTTFDVTMTHLHIACISALEQTHGKVFELADEPSTEQSDTPAEEAEAA